MVESIEAIVKLLLLQLRNFRDMGIAMERVVGIQSVPILRAVVVSLENGVWVPPCSIKIGSVG
jgi:hypothetical protein